MNITLIIIVITICPILSVDLAILNFLSAGYPLVI